MSDTSEIGESTASSLGESSGSDARRQQLLDFVRHHEFARIQDLARQLGVSEVTDRRDLELLERRGIVERTRGGAIAAQRIHVELAYEARRFIAREEKAAIGRAAAGLIPDDASLFINIGTTTEAVAEHLMGHRDLMVITNNLNVVEILADIPTIELIAAGGRVRANDRAIVGALAMDFIRGFKVDFALIGASAIDAEGTLLDFDLDEVRVSQTIIRNARQVILVADASKIGRPAPIRIGDMNEVDFLVTDMLDDAGLAAICREAGVHVVQTGC